MSRMDELYSDISVETEIMSASRHRIVQILFEKCLQQINLAKNCIANNDANHRNYAIMKSGEIILGLRASLNFSDARAQELSALLDKNYGLVDKCLINATLKNDPEYLDIAYMIINNIKSGWDGIPEDVK